MDTKYPWRVYVRDTNGWRLYGIYSTSTKADTGYARANREFPGNVRRSYDGPKDER